MNVQRDINCFLCESDFCQISSSQHRLFLLLFFSISSAFFLPSNPKLRRRIEDMKDRQEKGKKRKSSGQEDNAEHIGNGRSLLQQRLGNDNGDQSFQHNNNDSSNNSDHLTDLSLGPSLPPRTSQNRHQQQHPPLRLPSLQPPSKSPLRRRKQPSRSGRVGEGKSETIVPPYPWATDRRAKVYSRKELTEAGISTITGKVQCKKCERRYEIEYDLVKAFEKVKTFAWSNVLTMHDRAPEEWSKPRLPCCKFCGSTASSSVKPVISPKKRAINWLFLLLGQMLGCCTIQQLRYFCKHTNNHRTGAKDRLLYAAYFELCKQLDPDCPSQSFISGL